MDGHVAHWRDNLIGIQFIAIEQERIDRLIRIGSLNLAPPRLFNRKLAALLQAA